MVESMDVIVSLYSRFPPSYISSIIQDPKAAAAWLGSSIPTPSITINHSSPRIKALLLLMSFQSITILSRVHMIRSFHLADNVPGNQNNIPGFRICAWVPNIIACFSITLAITYIKPCISRAGELRYLMLGLVCVSILLHKKVEHHTWLGVLLEFDFCFEP